MDIRNIELSLIMVSNENCRNIAPESLEDLANNIKAVGLIQPIVVRETDDGFELIAGHRRLEAVRLLQRPYIEAKIIKATDQQAQTVRVTENLQRADLEPFEEAQAIQKLLDQGMNYKEAAAELGKTPQFVARRAQLLNLSPKWIEYLKDYMHNFSVAALEVIASCEEDLQDYLVEEEFYFDDDTVISGAAAQEAISEYHNSLKASPFKLDDDTLIPEVGSCTTCVKRTGRQPELFHDNLDETEIEKHEQCMDPECFKKKLDVYIHRQHAAMKEEHKDIILISNNSRVDRGKINGRELPDNVIESYKYDDAKKTDKNARPAILVNGPDAGKLVLVKIRASYRDDSGEVKGKKKGPSTLKQKEKKLEKRRFLWVVREVRDHLVNKIEAISYFENQIPELELLSLMDLLLSFGTGNSPGSSEFNSIKDLLNITAANRDLVNKVSESREQIRSSLSHHLRKYVYEQVCGGINAILNATEMRDNPWLQHSEIDQICIFLGLIFEDLYDKAVEAIPRPKSWPPEGETKKTGKKKASKKKKSTKKKGSKK
jgi:ParB/RepB/Spo0J family partition protein